MMTRNTVVGIFDDRDDAYRAIEALKDSGFRSEDIGITMRDRQESEALVEDTGASAGAGAATGALAGGALGGLAGWLVGIGALAIPGVGPFIAAGPLAAALTGAAIGAAGGGLLGALTGMGVPEDEARWYEGEVHSGGILVTVKADGRYDEARRMLRQYGGREADGEGMTSTATMDRGQMSTRDRDHDSDVPETASGSVVGGSVGAVGGGLVGGPAGAVAGAAIGGPAGAMAGKAAGDDDDMGDRDRYGTRDTDANRGMSGRTRPTEGRHMTEDRETVQLREEQLRARKEMVEAGEVDVRKEVVSEQRTIDVPVTREEVVIERRPIDRVEADRMDVGDIREGETIRVPVREEHVTVEKRPVVTEEVSVGKRQVTENERVSDTVRREEAVIDRTGDVNVGGDWSGVSNNFRTNWQSRYGTSGRTWEQDEPSYRYGWESARDTRYQGRQWNDVESDLGRDWSSRYGKHGAWDEVKDRTREAWDHGRR